MAQDVKTSLIRSLLASCRATDKIVIRVGGPGAVGKSSFSLELAEHLRQEQLDVSILAVDCYLRDRLERAALRPEVSGYDPVAYRLAEAGEDLRALVQGTAVKVHEYDKVTGTRGQPVLVRPAKVIIVEGSMALQPRFSQRPGPSIYLTSSLELLFENRRRRELELGFADDVILEKYRKLLPDFHMHIVTQMRFADIVVEVGPGYRFVSAEAQIAERAAG